MFVKIEARVNWLNPPENPAQRILREQVNVMAQNAADKLTDAVRLLVAQYMDAQRDVAERFSEAKK